MLNIFLILYWIFFVFFVGGCLAVIYHLFAYRMNNRISFLTIGIFIVGALILMGSYFIFGALFDWDQYKIVF